MVNTPIPHSLRSECVKAAKILTDFTMPSAKTGPDKIIPAGILVKAEGLAILTVVKIGFLVTARAGSGIVIAKLGNKRWSAPSAIGIAGLGGGFEVGAELTDFVIILNRRSAVDAFSKGGNLTLGGNFTIAAGPLGRNIEGDVSVRSPAAIYTYSKTKGLFAGISIEGSYLVERKDANRRFYGRDIRSVEILSGGVDASIQSKELYAILEHHEEMYDSVQDARSRQNAARGESWQTSQSQRSRRSSTSMQSSFSGTLPSSADCGAIDYDRCRGAFNTSSAHHYQSEDVTSAASKTRHSSFSVSHRSTTTATSSTIRKSSTASNVRQMSASASKLHSSTDPDWDSPPRCKALWSYKAQMPCDLSFNSGDVIEIKTRTATQDDWWEGVGIDGRLGIFPANYVQVI